LSTDLFNLFNFFGYFSHLPAASGCLAFPRRVLAPDPAGCCKIMKQYRRAAAAWILRSCKQYQNRPSRRQAAAASGSVQQLNNK
jgi:hypothetical protein